MDDDKLYVYKGDYGNYLEKKAARLESDSPVLKKQEIHTAKNWNGCESSRGQEQPKAKSRQDNFMKWRKKQSNRYLMSNCN
jgi:ATP-binding cassette subfamily F protein uup